MKFGAVLSFLLGFSVAGFEFLAIKGLGDLNLHSDFALVLPVILFGGAVGAALYAAMAPVRSLLRQFSIEILVFNTLLAAFNLALLFYVREIDYRFAFMFIGIITTAIWGAGSAAIFTTSSEPVRMLLFSGLGTALGATLGFSLNLWKAPVAGLVYAEILLVSSVLLLALSQRRIRAVGTIALALVIPSLLNLTVSHWHTTKIEKAYSNAFSQIEVLHLDPSVDFASEEHQRTEGIARPGFEKINVYSFVRNTKEATLLFDAETLDDLAVLRTEPPYEFMNFAKKGRIAIIGSGAGQEIAQAQLAGFKQITTIEINPNMIQAVRDFSRNPKLFYDSPVVDSHVGDARFFFRHLDAQEKFDAIELTNIVNYGNPAALFSSENYNLTADAIADYANHLLPHGLLIIRNNGGGRNFNSRLKRTVVAGLTQIALDDRDRLAVLDVRSFGNDKLIGRHPGVVIIFRKGGFNHLQLEDIRSRFATFERMLRIGRPRDVFSNASDSDFSSDDRPYPYWVQFEDEWIMRILEAFGLLTLIVVVFSLRKYLSSGNETWQFTRLSVFLSGAGYMAFQTLMIERGVCVTGMPGETPVLLVLAFVLSSLAAYMAREPQLSPAGVIWRAFATAVVMETVWVITFLIDHAPLTPRTFAIFLCALVCVPSYLAAKLFAHFTIESARRGGQSLAQVLATNGGGILVGGAAAKLSAIEFGANHTSLAAVTCYAAIGLVWIFAQARTTIAGKWRVGFPRLAVRLRRANPGH